MQVYYYKPAKITKDTKVVFIMHGMNRNASDYRDSWVKHAELYDFLLIAPEFSGSAFNPRSYNRGNMFDENGFQNKKSEWSFSVIPEIFNRLIIDNKLNNSQYYLYGHSAGSQFVHRLITFANDSRIKMVIAANAGWYTMPTFDIDYPYGLNNTDLTKTELKNLLSIKLIILLGTNDTDKNHRSLERTSGAMEQGEHRLDRGKSYFRYGENAANRDAYDFNWELIEVPDVGHNNQGMSVAAAELIDEN